MAVLATRVLVLVVPSGQSLELLLNALTNGDSQSFFSDLSITTTFTDPAIHTSCCEILMSLHQQILMFPAPIKQLPPHLWASNLQLVVPLHHILSGVNKSVPSAIGIKIINLLKLNFKYIIKLILFLI